MFVCLFVVHDCIIYSVCQARASSSLPPSASPSHSPSASPMAIGSPALSTCSAIGSPALSTCSDMFDIHMIAIHGFDDVLDSDDEVPVLPPMLPPSAEFGADGSNSKFGDDGSDSDDSLLAAASKSIGLLPSGVGGMKKTYQTR